MWLSAASQIIDTIVDDQGEDIIADVRGIGDAGGETRLPVWVTG